MDNRDWVTGRGQQGGRDGKGSNGEGETGRGRRGGGPWGQWGKRCGWEGKGWKGETGRGKRRVDFTDGCDEMPGWTYAIGLINGCKQINTWGDRRYGIH